MGKKTTKIQVKGNELIDTLKKIDLTKMGYSEGEKIAIVFNKNKVTIKPWFEIKMKEIRKLDDSTFEIFKKSHSADFMDEKKLSHKNKKTCFALSCLMASLTSVKLGIFSQCEQKNEYCANILLRSLIEHFLKVNYIFFRYLIEKNDSVGEDYQVYADAEELIGLSKSVSQTKKILNTNTNDPNEFYKLLCEMRPDYSKYKEKEVLDKVKQFKPTQIFKYIFREYTKVKDAKDLQLLLHLIPTYSELSSYVHGGPFATRESAIALSKNKVDENCIKLANIAIGITVVSMQFVCVIFGQSNKSFLIAREQIWKKWQEYSQNQNDE
jgi:phosphotransferase system IIB component